jgi:hypothetical protein
VHFPGGSRENPGGSGVWAELDRNWLNLFCSPIHPPLGHLHWSFQNPLLCQVQKVNTQQHNCMILVKKLKIIKHTWKLPKFYMKQSMLYIASTKVKKSKLHLTVALLLENRAFASGLIFHLHRVFFPPGQMRALVPVGATTRYKCPFTGVRRGLVQPTRYKCLTFVPGSDLFRFKCRPPIP